MWDYINISLNITSTSWFNILYQINKQQVRLKWRDNWGEISSKKSKYKPHFCLAFSQSSCHWEVRGWFNDQDQWESWLWIHCRDCSPSSPWKGQEKERISSHKSLEMASAMFLSCVLWILCRAPASSHLWCIYVRVLLSMAQLKRNSLSSSSCFEGEG